MSKQQGLPKEATPKELLFSLTKKDFVVQTFRAGGKGGQHQNKTESGVRIIHPASGAVGEGRSERSQAQNKKAAFERLIQSKTFQTWHKREVALHLIGRAEVDRWVGEQMQEKHLKVETFNPMAEDAD